MWNQLATCSCLFPAAQARRLAKHMREDIGRVSLRRRVAKLNSRLHAAGAAPGGLPAAGSPRWFTPSVDHELAHRLQAGAGYQGAAAAAGLAPPGQPLQGGRHERTAGGAAVDPCAACTSMAQRIAGLQQDVGAMRALLQQLCSNQAATGPSASAA